MSSISCTRALIYRLGDKRRKHLEKNFSTKQRFQKENPRIQGSYEHQGRAVDPQKETGKGKKASDSLTDPKDLRFPRTVRIRSRSDYLRIQKVGQKVQGRYLLILISRNNLPVSRFGITVSKRNRNAVSRNSIKRKIREIQRLNRDSIIPGHDVVVIARSAASEATFGQLEADYLQLVHRAGLMRVDLRLK
jgi:ribonuclease P protein component